MKSNVNIYRVVTMNQDHALYISPPSYLQGTLSQDPPWMHGTAHGTQPYGHLLWYVQIVTITTLMLWGTVLSKTRVTSP